MNPNQFSFRYAIRMPNGELYTGNDPLADEKASESAVSYYGMPGFMRDMMGIVEPTRPKPQGPRIFDDRAAAEELFNTLKKQATQFGITDWGGAVVEQLCTPFTSGDPSIEFASQVVAWVAENGGRQ